MPDTGTATAVLWRVLPVVALVALVAAWGRELGAAVVAVVAVLLSGAVLAAVQHAEVVAHRVGEPFGSLVLAVAVTVIEVSLIVTLMLSGGDEASTLARDTVFAAVMITVNGILGLSLLLGSRRFDIVTFNAEGTGGALATVATLATVCLVLPTVTTGEVGPLFTSGQLAFAAVASLALYVSFVVTQTVRHRDFFVPVAADGQPLDEDEHAAPPTTREAWTSLGFLLLSLVAVVGLAKLESPAIERRAGRRPAAGVRRRGHRAARAPAGDPCRRPERSPRAHPDEPQPRPRVGDGEHRAHHPGARGGLHLDPDASAARAGRHADRPARDHRRRGGADRGPRPGDPPSRSRAPHPLRGVRLPRDVPLSEGSTFRPMREPSPPHRTVALRR
jgi:Sodium/calcium exchanger protein